MSEALEVLRKILVLVNCNALLLRDMACCFYGLMSLMHCVVSSILKAMLVMIAGSMVSIRANSW